MTSPTPAARKRRPARKAKSNRPAATGFWSPTQPLPGLTDPIRPAEDPTATLASLGVPPLTGQEATAEHYIAAVVRRASLLATALAAAAGVLAEFDADEN